MGAGHSAPRHVVVAAAIVRGEQVLLCHRHPERTWYPNVWDLPGGHVEPDEPRLGTLARELNEELGIVIDPARAVSVLRHSPTAELDIEVWAVFEWAGEIVNAAALEHDRLDWFTVEELDALELADAGVAIACRRAIRYVAH